jgi:hypothetical protein
MNFLKVARSKSNFNPFESQGLTDFQLLKQRNLQRKRNKSKKLIREIIMNFVFLSVLFYVSYSSVNPNMFNYKNQLENVLTGYNEVN